VSGGGSKKNFLFFLRFSKNREKYPLFISICHPLDGNPDQKRKDATHNPPPIRHPSATHPLNRGETVLADGDEILVCKLRYRLKNPADKGKEVSKDDFEWWHVIYRAE
jgi:hypothetical protein